MDLFSIQEASQWATEYLSREITVSNISYLLQYGRIKKIEKNGNTFVSKKDLLKYYESNVSKKEIEWKKELGDDVNWALSFDKIREKERTKHVHRLHPYKGKFIPQLVEYFLDSHIDEFKKEVYFKPGDIVLDPFCGSGTTLVQANELGIHAIGVDISEFNSLISNIKIGKHDLYNVQKEITKITNALKEFVAEKNHIDFENELADVLSEFNDEYFPSPEYRYKVRNGEINQKEYGKDKELIFKKTFDTLVKKYNIQLQQNENSRFLDIWYNKPVREEIDFVFEKIRNVSEISTKKVLAIILSRTIRSCRATTHADLATLIDPIFSTYYCRKHGKMCKPLFSIIGWWKRYSKDTIRRLSDFNKIRTPTYQRCFIGDSRTINLFDVVTQKLSPLSKIIEKNKIKGIFTSPPYVGLIDYHEQHAYSYDLFGFERRDNLEIGPLFKGQGLEARNSYVDGISNVLLNSQQFLADDFHIFLVANDKYGIYPTIAEKAGMKIVDEFRRPVLNRTEKDKSPYSETIFHIRAK